MMSKIKAHPKSGGLFSFPVGYISDDPSQPREESVMRYSVADETRLVAGSEQPVVVLSSTKGARAEVWPALGYHPYLATTPDCRIQTPARARWELADSLPTGRRLPLDGGYDLREVRPVAGLTLDDVYTDLPATALDADGLVERGRVEYPEWG